MDEALSAWTGTLEKVFRTRATENKECVETPVYKTDSVYVCKNKIAKPRVFIPVFPGTNCEYNYIDGLMSRKESIMSLLKAKYYTDSCLLYTSCGKKLPRPWRTNKNGTLAEQ